MKKTTKENPITTFRKNFETRTKTVMSSLKKAQNGIVTNTTQGPLSKEDTERIDERYNNDINLANKMGIGKMPTIGGYSPVPELRKKDNIERVRSSPTFNTSKTNLYSDTIPPTRVKAKGGPVKTKMKVGGATKATKFAALAPPFNKATAADRIAGAKKNARKKK